MTFISPLSYFLDILNVGFGTQSAFGVMGLLVDFGFLIFFGFGFLFLAFILHKKTLQKRFKG
ncbi:MAG: hypothetical protein ACFFCI_18910 [Promethearchaeota archaeon]